MPGEAHARPLGLVGPAQAIQPAGDAGPGPCQKGEPWAVPSGLMPTEALRWSSPTCQGLIGGYQPCRASAREW